jgi:hypothetical protein
MVKAWQREIGSCRLGWPAGLPTVWTEDEFYGFLREFLRRAYERVLAIKPDATILLDKCPQYSRHVEHINWLIPNVKFIHIIRDGRDVAVSLLAASQGWGRDWAPKYIGAAAADWKALVLGAQRAGQYIDRYLEVRYEELLTDGVSVLKSVFEFIGIPIGLEEVASIYNKHQFESMQREGKVPGGFTLGEGFFRKGQIGDWKHTLSSTQRYVFHTKAGDLLCKLGYADKSWWIDHSYQHFTLPLIALLSQWNRSCRKAAPQALKRVLGPLWTERMRKVLAKIP